MTKTPAMHVLVEGHVQGVAFRWTTRDRARALGLVGWVRNVANGAVEVLAQGEPEALDELYEWLGEGPPHAQVEARQRTTRAAEGLSEFDVAPTARAPLS
ncbi:MAG: acylphosphatase [Planctomycetota bacterium]